MRLNKDRKMHLTNFRFDSFLIELQPSSLIMTAYCPRKVTEIDGNHPSNPLIEFFASYVSVMRLFRKVDEPSHHHIYPVAQKQNLFYNKFNMTTLTFSITVDHIKNWECLLRAQRNKNIGK